MKCYKRLGGQKKDKEIQKSDGKIGLKIVVSSTELYSTMLGASSTFFYSTVSNISSISFRRSEKSRSKVFKSSEKGSFRTSLIFQNSRKRGRTSNSFRIIRQLLDLHTKNPASSTILLL